MDQISDCSTEQSIFIMNENEIHYESCRTEMIQLITQSYKKFKNRLPTNQFSQLVTESLVQFYHEMLKKDLNEATQKYRREFKFEAKQSLKVEEDRTFHIERQSGHQRDQRTSNQLNQKRISSTELFHRKIHQRGYVITEGKDKFGSITNQAQQMGLTLQRNTEQHVEIIVNYARLAHQAALTTEEHAKAIEAFKGQAEHLAKAISQRDGEQEMNHRKISFIIRDIQQCQMQVQKYAQYANENFLLLLKERKCISSRLHSGKYREWLDELSRAEITAEEANKKALKSKDCATFAASQVIKLAKFVQKTKKRQIISPNHEPLQYLDKSQTNKKIQTLPYASSLPLLLSMAQSLPIAPLASQAQSPSLEHSSIQMSTNLIKQEPQPQIQPQHQPQTQPHARLIRFNRVFGANLIKEARVENTSRLEENQVRNSEIEQDKRANDVFLIFRSKSPVQTRRK